MFATLLAEVHITAKDLKHARADLADVLRERPRSIPPGDASNGQREPEALRHGIDRGTLRSNRVMASGAHAVQRVRLVRTRSR